VVCVWVVSIIVCLFVRFTIASASDFFCPWGCTVLLALVGEPLLTWLSFDHLRRVGGFLRWLWSVGLFRMFQLVWSRGPVNGSGSEGGILGVLPPGL